jgi:hypothetical protein
MGKVSEMARKKPAPKQKFTKVKRDKFVELIEQNGNIGRTCKIIGIGRTTFYMYRNVDGLKYDAKFARNVDDALENYSDKLEEEADLRATEGTPEPVFFRGEQCGEVMKKSDSLLMFRLKGLRPKKYRENVQHEVTGAGNTPLALTINLAPPRQPELPPPIECIPLLPVDQDKAEAIEEKIVAFSMGVKARARGNGRKAPIRLYYKPVLAEEWLRGWDETDYNLTIAEVNEEFHDEEGDDGDRDGEELVAEEGANP